MAGPIAAGIWFSGVLCGELICLFFRGMNGVVRYVAEKRLILIVLNKCKSSFRDFPDMMPVIWIPAFGAGAKLVRCQDIVESLRTRVAGAS